MDWTPYHATTAKPANKITTTTTFRKKEDVIYPTVMHGYDSTIFGLILPNNINPEAPFETIVPNKTNNSLASRRY